jgi:hypothetical protein
MTAVDPGSVPAGTGTEPHDVPMRRARVRRNGVWLVLPVLVGNMVLAGILPPGYGSDEGVPGWLLAVEWALRIVVFAAPVLMVVTLQGRAGRVGMVVYGVGLALYAASWAVVIAAGDAGVGHPGVATAPYWTPAVFLSGVAVLCRAWWYLVPVGLFTAAHTSHGLLSLGLV